MSFRYRILIFVAISLVVLTGALSLLTHFVIAGVFERMENEQLDLTRLRMQSSTRNLQTQLSRVTEDWAFRDETYAIARAGIPGEPAENLKNEDLAARNLQLVLIFDQNGQLLQGACADDEAKARPLPEDLATVLPPDHPWFNLETEEAPRQGYIRLGDTFYLVQARPILTSHRKGPPRGVVIVGQTMDAVVLPYINEMIQHPVSLSVCNLGQPDQPARHEQRPHKHFGNQVHLFEDTAYVHQTLLGHDHHPIATLCASVPRSIHAQQARTQKLINGVVFLTVLILGTGMMRFMERTMLHPLGNVIKAVLDLTLPLSTRTRLPVKGPGEIRDLSAALNQLLAAVEQSEAERQRALLELSAEKENLATTLESIADGVITTDTERRVLLMNTSAEVLTGWKEPDATGLALAEILPLTHEGTGTPMPDLTSEVLRSGDMVTRDHEVRLIGKNGRGCPVIDSCAPIHDSQGAISGFVVVFRDMTEIRRAAREQSLTDKLDAIGLLAGGIAHDFNNLLTAVLNNIALARRSNTPPERIDYFLKEAEYSIARANRLTQQLLTFASGGAPVKISVDLPTLIRHTTELICRGTDVTCHYHFQPELNNGWVDAGQIEQVIHNLVRNAVEAMPRGGDLFIRVTNVAPTDPDHPPGSAESLFVRVEIMDQGIGIPEAIRDRIFEPYFTTKQSPGGLGLASVRSIVTKHGGTVHVQSQEGEGTTFVLYLPATEKEADEEQTDSGFLTPGKGRVLFMDDEEMLGTLATNILENAGYQVDVSQDGATALELYARALRSGNKYDVIIVDLMVQGGMGGLEALKRISKIDPDVVAIVSSGYSNDPVMANYASHGFKAVLPKPYSAAAMTAALQRVLNERQVS